MSRTNKETAPIMKSITKTTLLLAAVFGLAVSLAHADDAQAIWDKQCAKCHGKDGDGQTAMGKKLSIRNLSDAKVQAEIKDEDITKAIKEGVEKDGKRLMKPAEGVSDDEVKALAAFVRGLKK
jgi:cytochrome c553